MKMRTEINDLKKKRGASNVVPRHDHFLFMDKYEIPSNEQPNNIKDYSFNMASFKTPNNAWRKRLSSFNNINRRPMNTLTIPKRGDHNSDFGSMSSIRSEKYEINMKKYTKYKAKRSKLKGSF